MLSELIHLPAQLAGPAVLLALAALVGAVVARALARRRRPAALPAASLEHDALTGLLSRAGFERSVQQLAAQAEAAGRDVCALYASLDGFRLVNDTHGRAFGDQVLQASARLIKSLAGQGAVVCRPGGDEFAVWLAAPRPAAEQLAAKLVNAFAQPLQLQGRPVALTLSVGVALAPEHGGAARILGLAAAAMHSVKRHGGAAHAVFEARIGTEHNEELAIARALAAKPKLLILDEPTEGIQPSIIKDIGRVIRMLADRGDMAILLVEQYYDFAQELADDYVVMERGEVIARGPGDEMEAKGIRQLVAI
jgi:diguanylate cyclase (GGDEF)-like protein